VRTDRRTTLSDRDGTSAEFRRVGQAAGRWENVEGARALLMARFDVDREEAFLLLGRLSAATTLAVSVIASTLTGLAVKDPARPAPDAEVTHRLLQALRAEAARRAQRA
jgi:hypothetical protein